MRVQDNTLEQLGKTRSRRHSEGAAACLSFGLKVRPSLERDETDQFPFLERLCPAGWNSETVKQRSVVKRRLPGSRQNLNRETGVLASRVVLLSMGQSDSG